MKIAATRSRTRLVSLDYLPGRVSVPFWLFAGSGARFDFEQDFTLVRSREAEEAPISLWRFGLSAAVLVLLVRIRLFAGSSSLLFLRFLRSRPWSCSTANLHRLLVPRFSAQDLGPVLTSISIAFTFFRTCPFAPGPPGSTADHSLHRHHSPWRFVRLRLSGPSPPSTIGFYRLLVFVSDPCACRFRSSA